MKEGGWKTDKRWKEDEGRKEGRKEERKTRSIEGR